MSLDPERLQAALTAIAGWALYGLFTLAGLLAAGEPATRRDIGRAAFNLVAALLAGVLVALVFGPALVKLIPLEPLREIHAAGFFIGAFTWLVLPIVFRTVQGWADRKAGEIAP